MICVISLRLGVSFVKIYFSVIIELPSTPLFFSNAFNFPLFGLQQEDFPLFSNVVENLVLRLLQQYAEEQDEHNRYVVSLNADILLY